MKRDGSAPQPTADPFAVLDDDDAWGRGPLVGGFSIGDLLGGWGRTTDDDEAAVDFDAFAVSISDFISRACGFDAFALG